MAKLEIFLTEDQFNGLDDSQKSYYTLHEGQYELDGIGAKVRGLETDKQKYEGFKGLNAAEARKAVETLKTLGVDEETIRQALDIKKKADEKKLIDKGDIEAIKQAVRAEYEGDNGKLTKLSGEYSNLKSGLLERELSMQLMQNGVRKEYADLARLRVGSEFDLAIEGNETKLTLKDAAKTFDGVINDLKTNYPALFEPSNASGSGASGSNGNGGGSARKWADLSRSEKTAAIRDADGDADAAQAKFQ